MFIDGHCKAVKLILITSSNLTHNKTPKATTCCSLKSLIIIRVRLLLVIRISVDVKLLEWLLVGLPLAVMRRLKSKDYYNFLTVKHICTSHWGDTLIQLYAGIHEFNCNTIYV